MYEYPHRTPGSAPFGGPRVTGGLVTSEWVGLSKSHLWGQSASRVATSTTVVIGCGWSSATNTDTEQWADFVRPQAQFRCRRNWGTVASTPTPMPTRPPHADADADKALPERCHHRRRSHLLRWRHRPK